MRILSRLVCGLVVLSPMGLWLVWRDCRRHACFLGLLLLAAPAPAAAQLLDPDRCWSCKDSYYHAGAGAALDVAVRSGIIAKPWRSSPVKRVALVLFVGAAYEGVETFAAWENHQLGQRGYGFGFKDLACDVAGAVALELVVALGRKVF